MRADPHPKAVFAFLITEGAIPLANTNAPKTNDFFEAKRRMLMIFTPEVVLLSSQLLI